MFRTRVEMKNRKEMKMGRMFGSYAFERIIEEYYEREGVSLRSFFRLFGVLASCLVISTGIVYVIFTILVAVLS